MGNKIVWLIEKDAFGYELTELTAAITKSDSEFKYIEGGEELRIEDCDFLAHNHPTLFYGTLDTAEELSCIGHLNIFSTPEDYLCSNYYPYISEYMLNSTYIMLPLQEIKNRAGSIFQAEWEKSLEENLFIRPNSGSKEFTGRVVSIHGFYSFFDALIANGVSPREICLIDSPRRIKREWRLVVADNQVITGSIYDDRTMNCDYRGYPKKVGELAQKAIDKLQASSIISDRLFTIDMCELEDGVFKVLEINGFSCAGLYDADLDIVVEAVESVLT